MGRDKALLPFGDEAMLQRVVRLVGEAVAYERIAVVAAAGQALPDLPTAVEVVRDEREFEGPLQGMAGGMRALANRADAAYVTGCDTPLVRPAFVSRMFERLGDCDIAVVADGDQRHPLGAVYRLSLLPTVEALLERGERAPRTLLREARTCDVDVADARSVDPELMSLRNVNDEAGYRAALELLKGA